MKATISVKVCSFFYDVTIDGGAIGIHISGESLPIFAQCNFATYKVITPFVGAAGAMLEMGITGNTPLFTKGAPIDPTIIPVGVWQDGGFSAFNVLAASPCFTTISVGAFTAGRLLMTMVYLECPE